MRGHIFRRIFLLYFFVLLLSVIVIELYITNVVRSDHVNNLKDSLLIQARLISENISFDLSGPLDEFCRRRRKSMVQDERK